MKKSKSKYITLRSVWVTEETREKQSRNLQSPKRGTRPNHNLNETRNKLVDKLEITKGISSQRLGISLFENLVRFQVYEIFFRTFELNLHVNIGSRQALITTKSIPYVAQPFLRTKVVLWLLKGSLPSPNVFISSFLSSSRVFN